MADFFVDDLRARMGKALPMLPQRPIDSNWMCHKSGECCSLPEEVVMTEQEMRVLAREAPKEIPLHFRPLEQAGMVAMKAQPCPLYVFQRCLVYEHRPYNCRRFACMRPDPKTEPLDLSETGSKNCMDRVRADRNVLKLAARIQRRAQDWAKAHGWVSA